MVKKIYADGSDQSECVERVKAQQEARKSDPRGHEGRPSRGFGDTRPARELPWLTSPAPDQVYRCFSGRTKKELFTDMCNLHLFQPAACGPWFAGVQPALVCKGGFILRLSNY